MTSLIPNSRRPDISFFASGRIDISARIARLLNICPGDVIDIVQCGDEWLLRVKFKAGQFVGRHHGKVFATHRSARGTLRVWSRPMARFILDVAGYQQCLRCPCGEIVCHANYKLVTIILRCAL